MAFSDLATLQQVIDWLNVSASETVPDDDEILIQDLITSSTDWIYKYLGRFLLEAEYIDVRDGTGGLSFMFAAWPVTVVDYIKVDEITIPLAPDRISAGYSFTPTKVSLRNYRFWRGAQNVEMRYTAGYNALDIPASAEQACIELVAQAYRERARIGIKQETIVGVDSHTYNVAALQPRTLGALMQLKAVAPISCDLKML